MKFNSALQEKFLKMYERIFCTGEWEFCIYDYYFEGISTAKRKPIWKCEFKFKRKLNKFIPDRYLTGKTLKTTFIKTIIIYKKNTDFHMRIFPDIDIYLDSTCINKKYPFSIGFFELELGQ